MRDFVELSNEKFLKLYLILFEGEIEVPCIILRWASTRGVFGRSQEEHQLVEQPPDLLDFLNVGVRDLRKSSANK